MTATISPLWTAGLRREVLPNGLTLLVQREDSAPAVAVVTHVRAGFFDEPDEWLGISHVLEHMFFKGTPTRGVGAVARETKAAGGYLNAHTAYDHTAYYVVLPATGLATALDIQSDALRRSLIDSGELARELQVIIQEAKRKLDSPGAVAHETLHEVMFDRHRIRRWRIGHEAQLATFGRADVHGYYASRYVPGRTIVSIVGDVDEEEALALGRERYGDWTGEAGRIDPSPDEPPHRDVRARTLRGDIAQAELSLGWRGVPALHADATALELAAGVLSAGRASWLYRSLRETGIVTSVGAHHYAPTEVGVFSIGAELEPERLPEAVRGIAEAVARLALVGPGEDDLERARRLLLARWARRMESMEGRAGALAAAEALDGADLLDREYAALEAVDAGQVREAAARVLEPDSVAGIAYLPHARGGDLTPELLAEAFAVTALTPLAAISEEPYAAPRRHARVDLPAPTGAVHHVALPGADLLIRPKRGVPMVTVGLYVPRLEFEPPAIAGVGALCIRSMLHGADGLDAGALAFAFERLGGTLSPSIGVDWAGLGTVVLAERMAEAATLLSRVFSGPELADRAIETERTILMSEAEQTADDMFRYPMQLAFAEAFGDRGYGVPAAGLPETLRTIPAAAVREWHQGSLLGARPAVIAVGDIDPARAADELAAAFDALPARGPAPPRAALPWAAPGNASRERSRDKAQTAMAMLFPGPARRDPSRYAADVWAAVASGLGGRLFEALRDRRSLAYTVFATSWQRGRAGALLTYIAMAPEREEEARTEMLREIGRFVDAAVSGAELEQATAYLAGQAQVRRQSGNAVAGEILEAWFSGTGLEELVDPAAAYRQVTADAVRAVAHEHLDPRRRVEGLVRGRRG